MLESPSKREGHERNQKWELRNCARQKDGKRWFLEVPHGEEHLLQLCANELIYEVAADSLLPAQEDGSHSTYLVSTLLAPMAPRPRLVDLSPCWLISLEAFSWVSGLLPHEFARGLALVRLCYGSGNGT